VRSSHCVANFELFIGSAAAVFGSLCYFFLVCSTESSAEVNPRATADSSGIPPGSWIDAPVPVTTALRRVSEKTDHKAVEIAS
jgi:hypothetical protein